LDNPTVRAQLEAAGVEVGVIHRNLPAPELTARSLARKEGILAANGALVVTTGARTGRSPADRYIVDDQGAAGVAWSGPNKPCGTDVFERQLERARQRDVAVKMAFVKFVEDQNGNAAQLWIARAEKVRSAQRQWTDYKTLPSAEELGIPPVPAAIPAPTLPPTSEGAPTAVPGAAR